MSDSRGVKYALQKGDVLENKVRAFRDQLQYTQASLAKATGVSRQTINAIETGRYLPSLPLALKLAKVLNQPVEHIFFEGARENES